MRNIIVVAFQLHYSKGSECAVAWDYVKHMSRDNKLTVLYGSSAGHHDIGNTKDMEDYAAENPVDNVRFIAVKPSTPSKNWDFSLRGIRNFYKEYQGWHRDVRDKVCELIKSERYDIIHYLGPIGFNEPGFLYNLPVPYIWGPIGGMGSVPKGMLLTSDFKYGSVGGQKLILKTLIARWRFFTNSRVRRALCDSDVVIGAITEHVRTIESAIGRNHHSVVRYLPENCMNEVYELNRQKFKGEKINMIFIGWMETRKAPMIILEALVKMGDKARLLHVNFLGSGPMKHRCEQFVRERGLEGIVTIHGRIERSEVFKMISGAQMMLLPSLNDANTTVVWEAMAHAVPTLCLDHCGMHDTIKEGSGVKIDVSSWNKVVNHVAMELRKIVETPRLLEEMAVQLLEDRKEYSWERRREKFEEIYTLAEEQFKKRKELN